jgi:hypothetical protein
MKTLTINQLNKKLENANNEIKALEEQKEALLRLFTHLKKKIDEGSVTIEPRESV